MKESKTDPCICTHKRDCHKMTSAMFVFCSKCYDEQGEVFSIHNFIFDNLGYLEMKYAKKHR